MQFPDKQRSEILKTLAEQDGRWSLDLSQRDEANLRAWSILEDLVFEGLLQRTPDAEHPQIIHYQVRVR